MTTENSGTAEHFRSQKQTILDEWERQVRRKVDGAGEKSRAALRDAIPRFLDQLFAVLAREEPKDSTIPLAVEHGDQRADLGSYSVEDVVLEYDVLRSVLTAVLEVREPVLRQDREIIVDAIFGAVRMAVSEFSAREKANRGHFEASLKEQLNALVEERQLREDFVSILSHDLRTPLTAARMNAQLLLRQRDVPGALEKLSGRIIENIDRTDDMIRNLLDANRIRAGEKFPLNISECDLAKVIRESLEDLTGVFGNRFVFRESRSIPGFWDAAALRRVMENLCGNAIKYGSAREIAVSIATGEGPLPIEVTVHNWGNPIPGGELEGLFRHFRRGARAEAEGQRGWGIGLTLVRGIAEAHGGRAAVASSAEKGTSFKVYLPRDSREVAGGVAPPDA